MSIFNMLKISYWFSLTTPPFRQGSFIAALTVIGLFFAGAIALKVAAKHKRENPPLSRGLARLARPLWFFSILGFALVWFREIGASIISARFWFALIFVVAAVWFGALLRGLLKTYQGDYTKIEERRKYEEYLPKRRK